MATNIVKAPTETKYNEKSDTSNVNTENILIRTPENRCRNKDVSSYRKRAVICISENTDSPCTWKLAWCNNPPPANI
jgi:hypothetical protein